MQQKTSVSRLNLSRTSEKNTPGIIMAQLAMWRVAALFTLLHWKSHQGLQKKQARVDSRTTGVCANPLLALHATFKTDRELTLPRPGAAYVAPAALAEAWRPQACTAMATKTFVQKVQCARVQMEQRKIQAQGVGVD